MVTAPPPARRTAVADDPDAALAAADEAVRQASASLVALEQHPGLRLLRTWPVTGGSARRRDEIVAAVASLHADLERYRDVVARAHGARGARARPGPAEAAAVDDLLGGPSVVVDEEIPLPRRGLLGRDRASRRATPADVLARMTAGFDTVSAAAARAAAVWDAVLTALDPLDADLDAATAALTTITDPSAGDHRLAATRTAVDEARAAVTAARREALADPLSRDPRHPVEPAVLAALRVRIRALREDADARSQRRAERPERLRALGEALDALDAEEAAVRDAAARVAREIAGAHRDVPPARGHALRAASGAAGLGDTGLTALADEVTAAGHTARRFREERAGLLERRAELRGRLGALEAKAAGVGLADHPDVRERGGAARALLEATPCDLAAATVALRAYQRSLENRPVDARERP